MSGLLQHLQVFVSAVMGHTVTLAAGCVATIIIAFLEKHVLKRPISLKSEIAVLLVFLFFACFQAWRDEYTRANRLQGELSQHPTPQIQVNIPPPPPAQVIIEHEPSAKASDLTGFQQLERIEPVNGLNRLVPSHPIYFNIYFRTKGNHPVHDNRTGQSISVLDMRIQGTERNARNEFNRLKERRLAEARQKHLIGAEVGVDVSTFITAKSNPLTDQEVTEIPKGTVRIYLLFYSTWKDSLGQSGSLDACYWLEPPRSLELKVEGSVWQTCQEPYR